MNRVFVAAALFVATIVAVAAQQTNVSNIPIRGRVVADDTGDPVAHARLVIWDNATPRAPLFTDNDGRFSSEPLPLQRRRFVFSKAGYASIDTSPVIGEVTSGLTIRLRRGGAISGRVVDAAGDPVTNFRVEVLNDATPGAKTVLSDDRGEYRVGSLVPGRYVVRVALADALLYYPSARRIEDARRIVLDAGDDKNGVDIVLDIVQPLSAVISTAPFVLLNNGRIQLGVDRPLSSISGGATIRGRVLQRSGSILSGATVVLVALDDARLSRAGASADDGTFVFENLASGRYRLSAMKSGYTPSDGGNRDTDAGLRVDVDGTAIRRADIVLSRPTAVTGQVLDEFGDPVEGANVAALELRYDAGRRHLSGVDNWSTDDRGRYRLSRLPPGRYIVSAAAGRVTQFQPAGELPGYALTYFPGTSEPREARAVTLAPSADTNDVNFSLVRTPTARIVGRALSSTGTSIGGGLTLNVSQRSGAVWVPTAGAERERDGSFVFPNVPPGDYVIQADRGRVNPATEGEFVATYVTVAGTDVLGVDMRATPGSTITGHVTFDATGNPPSTGFAIVPVVADVDSSPRQNGSIARADVKADLSFEIHGVHGARRLQLGERTPDGWVLKSILSNGMDVTDRALPFGEAEQSLTDVEVVLTNKLTELTGAVTDERGQAAHGYTLLIFSTDRARWYPGSRFFGRGEPDTSGAFTVRGLPPGEYSVAAVAGTRVFAEGAGNDDAWQDPDFLESIAPRASRAALVEGQKFSLNLRLIAP